MSGPVQKWRYDFEWCVAPIVADYLENTLDEEITKCSPVVTFFDPMAIDEENRIVVEVPNAKTMKESPGNFYGTCKVTVKSQWAQTSVQEDMKSHYHRTKWTRDALMSSSLVDVLNNISTQSPVDGVGGGGLSFDYIQPSREFSTDVREGWIYSETIFQFTGFIPA